MFITEDFTNAMLPWETLEALLKGVSSIDLTAFPITSRDEAYDFVLKYGYDLRHPDDEAEIRGILAEAVVFIETLFLNNPNHNWVEAGEPPSPALTVPEHLLNQGDFLDLILLAAKGQGPDQPWACAILKVMHTIAHIQNGPLYRHFEDARAQILSGFDSILTPLDGQNEYLLGKLGGRTLQLFGFEVKDHKSRESILVKLLCKKEHVAEVIWDLIGVRLITHTPAEAVLAINILREHKVIVSPNIIPSRSRNSLVDMELYREGYNLAYQELQDGKIDQEGFEAKIRQIEVRPVSQQDFTVHNPSSSHDYHSIHITCRQLIRVKTPGTPGENRFFFPYEIQILDKDSFLQSKEGSSAHRIYKNKQLSTARRRVLGLLLKPKSE